MVTKMSGQVQRGQQMATKRAKADPRKCGLDLQCFNLSMCLKFVEDCGMTVLFSTFHSQK